MRSISARDDQSITLIAPTPDIVLDRWSSRLPCRPFDIEELKTRRLQQVLKLQNAGELLRRQHFNDDMAPLRQDRTGALQNLQFEAFDIDFQHIQPIDLQQAP